MATDHQQPVIIGRVGGPHGVKGYLKIHSFTEPAANIIAYQPWKLQIKGEWRIIEISDVKQLGNTIIAQIDNISDRDEARRYTNCDIAVDRTLLPDTSKGEYYWNDLIGLTVIDINGDTLGQVTNLIETGANDVLVVKGNKEFAVPFILDDVIQEVDLTKGTIIIKWDPTEIC